MKNIIDDLFSAILDGYNAHQLPRKSRFPRTNPLSAQLFRSVVVYEVRRALDSGIIVPIQVGNDPDDWCDSMDRDGTYTDHTFFEMSAKVLDSDIVIVHLHGTPDNPCHVIRAGLLGNGGRGRNPPIFIGYFEEVEHSAGHFQSLMPFRDGPILDIVKNDGGIDVAELNNLPARTVLEEEEISFVPSVNSTHFQTPAQAPGAMRQRDQSCTSDVSAASTPQTRSDVTVTPPPPATPFSYAPRVPTLPCLSLSEMSESPTVQQVLEESQPTNPSSKSSIQEENVDRDMSPLKPKRSRKRKTNDASVTASASPPGKRVRSPSQSPIRILRFSRNKQNDEWKKLAAATRKSRRIRDQKKN